MENNYAVVLMDNEQNTIPWPLDLRLPAAGDEVVIQHDRSYYSLKVTSRLWVVSPNSTDGTDTLITIRVDHLTPPSLELATVHPIRT